MSRTRNQRAQIRKVMRRVLLVAMSLILAASVALMIYLWTQVEALRKESRTYGPIVSLDMLPELFDEAEYIVARQRYAVEEHLILPREGGPTLEKVS